MKSVWLIAGSVLAAYASLLASQPGSSSIHISSIQPGQLVAYAFEVSTNKFIRLEAVGAGRTSGARGSSGRVYRIKSFQTDPSGMLVYAWIIDQNTRQLVWRMDMHNTVPIPGKENNRRFSGQIELPPGSYELYFYASKKSIFSLFENGFPSLGQILHRLLRGEKWEEELRAQWQLTLEGADRVYPEEQILEHRTQMAQQALAAFFDLHDSEYRRGEFVLQKPALVEIYSLGEAFEGEEFDHGWIQQIETGQNVWEGTFYNSQHAGGAIKNRVWRDTLLFAPGTYVVAYQSDDSHSPEGWNANPPYDPYYWGLMLRGIPGEYDPASVQRRDLEALEPLVEIIRVPSNAREEAIFDLQQPTTVHLIALGEGMDGEMYDYGWLENLDTGEEVWRMSYQTTRHAGGARKNRIAEKTLQLPPGRYRVVYRTDDSHAYKDWNAHPPYNPTRWGITILPVEQTAAPVQVQKVTRREKEVRILAKLVKVGNSQHRKAEFTLSQEARVRVLAVGEGDWEQMYDYGWIEEKDTGQVVWIMEYNETLWAGGAQKNRKTETVLTLEPGTYLVHYITDESHAYNSWNDDPPDHPELYGITVVQLDAMARP